MMSSPRRKLSSSACLLCVICHLLGNHLKISECNFIYTVEERSLPHWSAMVGILWHVHITLLLSGKHLPFILYIFPCLNLQWIFPFYMPLWTSLVVMVLTVHPLQDILQSSATLSLYTASALICWHLKYVHFVDSYSQKIHKTGQPQAICSFFFLSKDSIYFFHI